MLNRRCGFLCAALISGLLLSGCSTSTKHDEAADSTRPVPQATRDAESADPMPRPGTSGERPSGPVHFTDVTQAAGIRFRHNSGAFGKKYLPETMGSGVCAIDYDNDGWQDLLFVNSMDWPEHKQSKTISAFYHNNHDGTFSDATRAAGLAAETYGMGCAVADFDNDGHDDVYITALDGNHLYHNLGNGKFRDITAKAGVKDAGFSTGAIWFDYDRDGKLDLYVAHYVDWSLNKDQFCTLDGKNKSYCTPELYKGQSGKLFHNKGNGVFEDVTAKAGMADATSKALGVVMLDYDNDGWPDLLVTNDTQANKLYRNNHDGTFTENAFSAGVAFSDAGKARAGMGADAADYDGSGKQGLVIGNFTNESLALYHNEGGGLFADKGPEAGLSAPSAKSLTFSSFFFDYNLDGLPDIFALNGHVADDISVLQPSVKYAEAPLLFRNKGNGKFEDVSDKVGSAFRQTVVGRGAAYLDFDNDGDLDLAITTSNGVAKLLRNDNGNSNDMLRVKTVGTHSNRDGIGSKVTIKLPNGSHQMQMVKSGSSYLSQSELPLTFGLGKPQPGKVFSLEIVWPDGRKESVSGLQPNQSLVLEEGNGVISALPINLTKTSASH